MIWPDKTLKIRRREIDEMRFFLGVVEAVKTAHTSGDIIEMVNMFVDTPVVVRFLLQLTHPVARKDPNSVLVVS